MAKTVCFMFHREVKYYLSPHSHGFMFSSDKNDAEVFRSKKAAEIFVDSFDDNFVCLGWTIFPKVYFENKKKQDANTSNK